MIKIKKQAGQILVITSIALGVVLFTVLSVIAGAQIYYSNSTYSLNAEKATALAEAGVDKAVAALNKTGGSYLGEAETGLGDGSYFVTITSTDAATKVIEATGYIPDKSSAKAKKTIKITATRGIGAAFNYGIQVGEGGLALGNNNEIQGSIYSNGPITMGNDNEITGDAWAAAGAQVASDQATDCSGANCSDSIFGKVSNGELDIAESFIPGCINPPACAIGLNKISLKLKKVGNPTDITVRIMGDNTGKPDKNNILASGSLHSSLVTTSYGWIDVTFDDLPVLSSGTTYWMMIDSSASSSNYWSWQSDLAKSYNAGVAKWSVSWNAGNPVWSSLVPDGDLSFKTVMGGNINSITGGNNTTIAGNAHANTISGITINKDAYYQTIINTTVRGTEYPNSTDPTPKVFPISDANVTDWKTQAQNNTLPTPTCGSTWGPGKYTGNITLSNTCTITVKSPIWITGNLNLGNSDVIKLDGSFTSTSGVIVLDGILTLGNSNKIQGTGVGSSLLMVLTTFDSLANGGASAVVIGNTGNSGVYYASHGIIEPGNSNQYKELTAWQIKLTNNSTINYETGLSSTLFTSGPSGVYSLVKGTYQVK